MTSMLHILDRLFGQPLFLLPQKASTVVDVVLARSDLRLEEAAGTPEASRFVGSRRRADGGGSLTRMKDGVAVIDVVGSLVNRGAWVGASSGLVSYEGIGAQVDAAVEGAKKGEIKGLVIDINSPGGEATGMFAAAEKIRSARAYLPIIAVVNDMAASAAYGLASAANEIVISPTSLVGSIGVVFMHIDRTAASAKAGIVETAIYAGANKTLGMGTLTPEAKASFQSMVDAFYERFLETVEAGRGERTTAEAARATEASVYIGREAIEKGLAERVGTFDEVLSDLSTRPATRRASNTRLTMSTNTNPVAAADPFVAAVAEAQAAARAEAARLEAEAIAERAVDAAWSRSIARAAGQQVAAEAAPGSVDDVWNRAIARASGKAVPAASARTENGADGVTAAWDRALVRACGVERQTVDADQSVEEQAWARVHERMFGGVS